MPKLAEGTMAPDFELPDQAGKPVRLRDYLGKSPVVVYFYPKDDTTGCTIESCEFRDQEARFRALGAEILGVSDDSSESHARFAAKYNLPFQLLSDKGGRVRKLYGVQKIVGLIPRRVTFVVDRQGVIRHVCSSQTNFAGHVAEALGSVQRFL
jgi:peroxiredoxin Q/BCP